MTSANASGETQVEKSAVGMSSRFAGVSMIEGNTVFTMSATRAPRLHAENAVATPKTPKPPVIIIDVSFRFVMNTYNNRAPQRPCALDRSGTCPATAAN